MGLSRNAYAKHRGVSETAVRKALKAGRIELEPDGSIDPAKADEAWTGNRAYRGRTAVPKSAVEAVSAVVGSVSDQMTFADARTAHEILKAQERQIKLEKLKGTLCDREHATQQAFAFARAQRDAFLQWPARVAAILAAEIGADAHRVEIALEAHVRQFLDDRADIAFELR